MYDGDDDNNNDDDKTMGNNESDINDVIDLNDIRLVLLGYSTFSHNSPNNISSSRRQTSVSEIIAMLKREKQ